MGLTRITYPFLYHIYHEEITEKERLIRLFTLNGHHHMHIELEWKGFPPLDSHCGNVPAITVIPIIRQAMHVSFPFSPPQFKPSH